MSTNTTIDLLQKLVTLTSERESHGLERALLKAIAHLTSHDAVLLYQLQGEGGNQISALNDDGKQVSASLPDLLKSHLLASFKSAKPIKFNAPDISAPTLLYPLQSNKHHITSVIAVTVQNDNAEIELAIKSLLQIYQNHNSLINENEHDTLTGLLNRKTFESKINKVLSTLISLHKRKSDHITQKSFLAIFDIDHFKRVNDDFGHLIGDEVLLMFSQLMTKTFREQDMLFRFGGEEFVAVFECPSIEDISRVLNRFREKVSAFNFPQIGRVTVSIGYTEVNPHDNASILIDRADAALYYAKNNGRNCTHHYEQLVTTGLLNENKVDGDIELF